MRHGEDEKNINNNNINNDSKIIESSILLNKNYEIKPHPIDGFQLSAATKEFGDEYTTNSISSMKRSPRLGGFTYPYIVEASSDTSISNQPLGLLQSDSSSPSLKNQRIQEECLFRVRISGVQCRNLEARKFRGTSDPFVEFYWADEMYPFSTPVLKGDLNPTFKGVTFNFDYSSIISNLKKKYLTVKVYSNRTFTAKKLIGSTKVDLFTIATGPVHHDHNLLGCENGRVVFNCYMEQFSDWQIAISNINVLMPPKLNYDYDRPEGHDFQEDYSLPLTKYSVSYKCTIGTSETFYTGNTLKEATNKIISNNNTFISNAALNKLKIISNRRSSLSRTSNTNNNNNNNTNNTNESTMVTSLSSSSLTTSNINTNFTNPSNVFIPPIPTILSPILKRNSKSDSNILANRDFHPNNVDNSNINSNNLDKEPLVGVEWSSSTDALPQISRYSTFDELMSATLKLEIRCFMVGRGQIETDTDSGFLLMLDKYEKDIKHYNEDVKIDSDIKNTSLFGQSCLSLEKLFEDALQEKIKKKMESFNQKDNSILVDRNTLKHERFPSFDSSDDDSTNQIGLNNPSFIPPFITCHFEQNLCLKGHQVGVIYGTLIFRKIPAVRQLRSGVISENGISSSSSVIVGLPNSGFRKGGVGGQNNKKIVLPEEAQRVLDKMEGLFELMAMRQKDDKDAKIRKATKILKVLQISHKASMLSWVYASNEALEETKDILLRLWQFLLENIRVRNYTLRNIFYELLFYLVKKAELSDLPLLGFDNTVFSNHPLTIGFNNSNNNSFRNKQRNKHLAFGLKLRAMLLETKFCILQALSVRGVMNNNFMFFVARIISVLCFRLPSFGVELYQLWAQSYTDPVEELSAEFQQNADADLFAMDGLEAHMDWRRFHKALYLEFGEKLLKSQEDDSEDKYEVVPDLCKARFKRILDEPNTLNILIVDQWMWNVLDTLAVLNQKIGWSCLPGYAQILKVFFLELRTQKFGPLSPALYKLSCTMLSNYSLINPMTKFLLSRTSVHDVPGVISAVELLGVWMYMIRSWRVRLSSYRLSHLENNDRWNFHQDVQYSIPAGDEVSLLPPAFDYRFLCSALKILLTSEHTQVLLTTLEFLYNCWDCFPERHADKLRNELIPVFLRFFLHWHSDVRHFYHTVLAYRAMKPHGWTQKGASFVSTPPHSRRHIDAVGADFTSALGPEELIDYGKRSRSYSASSIIDSVLRLSSPRNPNNSSTPHPSPRNSPNNSSTNIVSIFNSPKTRSNSLTFSSPKSTTSSPTNSVSFSPNISERKLSIDLDTSNHPNNPYNKKIRSISEDLTRPTNTLQQKMDPSIQLRFNRLLESVYSAAKSYIKKTDLKISTNTLDAASGKATAAAAAAAIDLVLNNKKKVKASWKKKGILLKQGFIYKNTWKQKYFSLQNNKLGYSDNENSNTMKREIHIIGATITELPNQIDQTHGTRLILHNCFSVDNGYQKLTLCAPTYDEAREWMDVLTQNAQKEDNTNGKNNTDELNQQWNMSDIAYELEGLTGNYSVADETVPENLIPYTPVATKEWLTHHVNAMAIEARIAVGQPFDMPILLSKSSSYTDDV